MLNICHYIFSAVSPNVITCNVTYVSCSCYHHISQAIVLGSVYSKSTYISKTYRSHV